MQTYGYNDQKEAFIKRLKRIEGQVRGVTRMVDEDMYCIDILTQITALQAAVDKVALGLLGEHAKHCLAEDTTKAGRSAKADELTIAVGRLLSR